MAEPCELADKPWGRAGVPQWGELWSSTPEALSSISTTTAAWHGCGSLQSKHSRAAGWRIKRWSSSSASEVKASLGYKRPVLRFLVLTLASTPPPPQVNRKEVWTVGMTPSGTTALNTVTAFLPSFLLTDFKENGPFLKFHMVCENSTRFRVGKEAP